MIEHDILLGRNDSGEYITLGGGAPVALHAPTGLGKTSEFVIPNCFTWKGSLVVLDIKGEAWEETAGHRAKMGQDVYLFEPASASGRTHRWNPFSEVNRRSISQFKAIATIANLLFPEVSNGGTGTNDNAFWDNVGRKTVIAISNLLAETPDQDLTLGNIARLFARSDGHEWMSGRIEMSRGTERPYSQIAVDGISDYVGDDPKLRGDIRQTVSTRMQTWFYDPQICAATAASDFSLNDLRRKPMTVYVVVEPGDIPRLKPLLRLFFDQAVSLNTIGTPRKANPAGGRVNKREDPTIKHQALFLLDEFAQLGRIDSLAHAAQYSRGFGVRMAYIVQDVNQLRGIYGDNGARDILSNVAAELIFGVTDSQQAQDLEKRLGDNTVTYTNRSRPRFWAWANMGRQSESDHPHKRPLMLAQEIVRMPADQQLILRRGVKPMLTGRARWFDNPEFSTRVKLPPEVPKLDVSIAYDDGATSVRPRPPPELNHRRP